MRERISEWGGAAVVFASSAAILILEILATRVLAPIVGLSLETYTTIIGVVLAGIALGAWLGGWAADRRDPRRLLPWALVLGGVGIAICGPILRVISPAAEDSAGWILLLTVAGFLAPAAVLSAVPPLVVKIRLRSLHHTGGVVGRYSAISTAGALVGSFAAGFVLVPAFPVSALLLALGLSQVLLGLGVWAWMGGRVAGALAGVALVAGAGIWALAQTHTCERESIYACIEIEPAWGGGDLLILDGVVNAHLAPDPRELQLTYIRRFGAVADQVVEEREERSVRALHIGGGGLTIPRYLDAIAVGRSENTVLEIDPEVIEALPDYAQPAEGWVLLYGDARSSLEDLQGPYDLVVGDAFSGTSVPWQLTTAEAAKEIKQVMPARGIYVMNIIDGAQAQFVRAELATLADEFSHTALVAPRSQLEGEGGGNWILLASDKKLGETLEAERLQPNLQGEALREWVGGAEPLRDDYAPAEQLKS